MALKIKQGDAYAIPVAIEFDGAPLNPADVSVVEFVIGGIRKLYPDDVQYDRTDGYFYLPLTQEETFSFEADGSVELDIRVKYASGDVEGIQKHIGISVVDAVSEEVL